MKSIHSFLKIFTLALVVQETWTSAVPSETTTQSQRETTIESQTEATTLACHLLAPPFFTWPCAGTFFSLETCKCETDERCPHVGPPG